jgi:hypothetical protein
MFEQIAKDAIRSLVEDESLYGDLVDYEATILRAWAEERIAITLSAPLNNDDNARQAVAHEVKRLKAAFKAIDRQVGNFMSCERGVVIASATAIISELWNGGN